LAHRDSTAEVKDEAEKDETGKTTAFILPPSSFIPSYGVRMWVRGVKSSRATGIAGYSAADRRLTGSAQLELRNLLGTGRKLAASWQSAWALTSYSLSYTEPWVLGTTIDLTAAAQHQVQDTSYARTDLSLTALARTSPRTGVRLETGFDQYVITGPAGDVKTVWGGTGVVTDSRDVPANPAAGWMLDVRTKAGTRTETVPPAGAASVGLVGHTELDAEAEALVAPSLTWSNSVGARWVYAQAALTESELYQMGGSLNLRGYNENEFTSDKLGWVRSELRYRLGRTNRVYPFVDAGTYHDSLGWQVKPAYGAGLRVGTGVGLFGLDYGVAFGESPARGKVHLRFETEF
jgi:outer membrane protein assembly factor BamA